LQFVIDKFFESAPVSQSEIEFLIRLSVLSEEILLKDVVIIFWFVFPSEDCKSNAPARPLAGIGFEAPWLL